MRQSRPWLRRIMIMVVMMVMVDLLPTRRARHRRPQARRRRLSRKLRVHLPPRSSPYEVDGMVHNLRAQQRFEVLPHRAHASREGDYERVFDRPRDGARERGELGLLERR